MQNLISTKTGFHSTHRLCEGDKVYTVLCVNSVLYGKDLLLVLRYITIQYVYRRSCVFGGISSSCMCIMHIPEFPWTIVK